MGFLKKPDHLARLGVPVFAKSMQDSVNKLPALVEYLTLTRYEDGDPRKESKLTVMIEDASWKMALNDVDNGRSLWVSGPSIMACLAAMEAKLTSDDADWRTWKDWRADGGGTRSAAQKKKT